MSSALLGLSSFVSFAHPSRISSELEVWYDLNKDASVVVAYLIYEFYPGTADVIEAVCRARDIAARHNKKFVLIADDQYKQYEHKWPDINIVYLSYWAMFVKVLTTPPQTEWNRNATKALFLTGKLHSMNRIGALASAYKSGIISKLKYSFMYVGDKFDDYHSRIIRYWGIPPVELIEYLNMHRGITDLETADIPATKDGFKDFEFYCDITDPGLFTSTRVSLVSESASRTTPAITEKVWKAIAFNHPFVLLAVPGTHEYLESIGVTPYCKFFPSTIEMGTSFTKAQVDNALDNVEWFLTHKEHDDDVCKIIEQNKQQYHKLADAAIQTVNDVAYKLALPSLMHVLLNRGDADETKLRRGLVDRALQTEIEICHERWDNFYDTIKGSDWPATCALNEVDSLINDELVCKEIRQYDLRHYVPSLSAQREIFLSEDAIRLQKLYSSLKLLQ